MGDIPIYVAFDSADTWANFEVFQLHPNRTPIAVAGVPPDVYSTTGQLWGNPLYNWTFLETKQFSWWVDRIKNTLKLFDYIRLDHFRGFASYYSIPYPSETAINGTWKPGPRRALFDALVRSIGDIPFIVEDLGYITPDVIELREQFGYPAMKILQFGLGGSSNDHTPHNLLLNQLVYSSIHDTDTAFGWFKSQNHETQEKILKYTNGDSSKFHWSLINEAWKSVANISIAQMQDILGLGSEARMNKPGTAQGNWKWRYRKQMLTDNIPPILRTLNKLFDR